MKHLVIEAFLDKGLSFKESLSCPEGRSKSKLGVIYFYLTFSVDTILYDLREYFSRYPIKLISQNSSHLLELFFFDIAMNSDLSHTFRITPILSRFMLLSSRSFNTSISSGPQGLLHFAYYIAYWLLYLGMGVLLLPIFASVRLILFLHCCQLAWVSCVVCYCNCCFRFSIFYSPISCYTCCFFSSSLRLVVTLISPFEVLQNCTFFTSFGLLFLVDVWIW